MILLLFSALSLGCIHTLLGPDHYVPFVVLAKSRNWSMLKTITVTSLCGAGHILSAVIFGIIAIGFGFTLSSLDFIESFRGEIAAWLLIGFGFAYFIWGVRNAIRNKKHTHLHLHANGSSHTHSHGHVDAHAHVHTKKGKELTPWILFIVFVFGPCEVLIPLIMYPALQESILSVVMVTLVFSLSTIVTMITMVLAMVYGTKKLPKFKIFERFGNAMAGVVICGCGMAIKFLGL